MRRWMIAALTLGIGTTASAQVDLVERKTARQSVFVDALSYAARSEKGARLEVYVQVPYEEVRFLKKDEFYVGQFDITVAITTREQEPVWNRMQTVEVRTRDFAQTVSNRLSSLKQLTFDMSPGEYEVRVEIFDQDSKRTAVIRREVTVPDFSAHALSLSDAMLVSRVTTSGERTSIIPNISGMIVDDVEGFFVFTEVYAQPTVRTVHVIASIVSSNGDTLRRVEQTDSLGAYPHQQFLKFTALNATMGTYALRITATAVDSAGRTLRAETVRKLGVRWSDLPATISDLDKAIEQMRYVARDAELQHIRDGRTEDQRKDRFLEFWKKRDPDPQTQRNELMEEYYNRVEHATRNFGHYVEGWRTDRGMIFIRFGAPDNVERHPFETNTRPYEVWRYYNLNYEFVFVDETGFGDYRLRYPATDLLGRIRPDQ